MINIIVGKPGEGKTYSLVRQAYKEAKKGRNVYSNFYIKFPQILDPKNEINRRIFFWDKITDFVNIKKGVIIIDEVQIYFNSRGWKELPPKVQYKFQQHRKQGLDIWGATQNIKRIDTIIREIVNTVYSVKKLPFFFHMKSYDVEDIDKANKNCHSNFMFPLKKTIANSYDTFQEIDDQFLI